MNYLSSYNFRIIAYGFLLTFASSFGQTFFIALFAEPLIDHYHLSRTAYGALYSAATLCSAILLFWSGKWADQHSPQRLNLLFFPALATGCVLIAASEQLMLLFVALVLLRQFGQGLLPHLSVAIISRAFHHGRGRALSYSSLGFPIAEALLPLLAVLAMSYLGWQASFYVIAVLLLLVFLPLGMYLLRAAERAAVADVASTISPPESPAIKQWRRAEVLKDPPFYGVLLAVTASAFVITGLFFHQVHISDQRGWSLTLLASSYIGFSLSQILFSLLTGKLIDKYSALACLSWLCVPLILTLLSLAFAQGSWSVFLYMALLGVASGVVVPLTGALLAETYGTEHIGAIKSLSMIAMVLMSALAPLLFGWLIDLSVSVQQLALLNGAYCILCWLASIVAARQIRRRQINLHL
ncbi:MAG: MFS family permease [Oceanicoccus sp.]